LGRALNALREGTKDLHASVEKSSFARILIERRLTREAYVEHLASHFELHAALEAAVARTGDPRVAAVWRDEMVRTCDLRRDLEFLGSRPGELRPDVARVAREAVAAVARASGPELLGMLYVFEGSAMGATFLLARIREQLGLGADGTRYYGRGGPTFLSDFQAFGTRLDEALASDDDLAKSLEGARACFEAIGRVFDTLGTPRSTVAEHSLAAPRPSAVPLSAASVSVAGTSA
jgi:heme oxygenase